MIRKHGALIDPNGSWFLESKEKPIESFNPPP